MWPSAVLHSRAGQLDETTPNRILIVGIGQRLNFASIRCYYQGIGSIGRYAPYNTNDVLSTHQQRTGSSVCYECSAGTYSDATGTWYKV
jgi:hypothetical protein